jgi:hypothetical protein
LEDIDNEYEVEEILGRKNSKAGLMYYVKWRNYDVVLSTWEPVTHLLNSLEFVKEFERKMSEQDEEIDGMDGMGEEDIDNQLLLKRKRIFKEDRIFNKPVKSENKKENGGV